ncbi:hypothetical protein D3C76_65060 [compost metagenome]
MNSPAVQPRRERALDLFKGLLVIGMVYCHSLQFFSDPLVYPAGQYLIDAFNLITFSGFVFSFGYVSQRAYYAKSFRAAAPRMLQAALRTLIGFYISGIAYRLLIDGQPPVWKSIQPVLLVQDMPGWSEFLLSFTYLTVVGLVLFQPLRWMAEHKAAGFTIALLLLAATLIPYGSVHGVMLGPLIGARGFATFPVLQYFPYYIAGMVFARHGIRADLWVLLAASAATGAFIMNWLVNDRILPERFPPSIWWITGPALPLYTLYLLARLLERAALPLQPLETLGRNVLWFLVMSNILIFALRGRQGNEREIAGVGGAMLTAAVLLLVSGFAVWIIAKPPRRRE